LHNEEEGARGRGSAAGGEFRPLFEKAKIIQFVRWIS